MATNISVTLVVDNKKYIADLTNAENATKKFAKASADAADGANTKFSKLNTSTTGLSLNLGRLSTVVGGALVAGFGATAVSAFQMANAIDDLSKATGLAIGNIVGFQEAVKLSGGNAEQAAKGLTYFFTQIDAAAEGGAKAQLAFQSLNIGLNDLRTLSEGDLFQKTVEGLAKMEPSARKTTLQAELLGKAFRNITIDAQFVEDLRNGTGEASKMADAIKRAADLNDQFEASWTKLRLAFLQAFGPVIDGLATMAEWLSKAPKLVNILSIALLAIPGMAIGRGIVAGLSFAAKGLQTLTRGAVTARGALSGLYERGNSAASQALRNMGTLLGGAGAVGIGAAATGIGWSNANKEAEAKEKAAERAASANKKEGESVREVTSALAAKTQAIQQNYVEFQKQQQAQIDSINLDARLIGTSKDFADSERARQESLKRSQAEIDKLTAAKANMSKEDRELGLGAVYDAQIAKIKETQAAEADRAAKATENLGRLQTLEQKRLYGLQQEVNLNRELAGIQDQIATQMLPEIEKRYYNIDAAARAAAAAQIASEEARLNRKLNTEEVANYYEIAARGADRLKAKQLELLDAESKRNLTLFAIKTRIDEENKLLNIQDEMAKQTLPDIEKKYYDIAAAARDSAKAAIEAEEARLGRRLSTDEVRKYYDAASAGSARLAKQTKALYDQSRTFSTGWKKAFNDYKDAAQNSAAAAARIFEKFTSGLEDALVNFAKTGKFEWKQFVADMAEELLRSQIKQTLASLGSALGIGDWFGGGAGATPGNSPTNPMYVVDINGGGQGGGGAGIIGAANRMVSGGGIGGGGNLLGSVGKIASSIGSGISSVVSGIGSAIGGAVSSIGSVFSGGGSSGGGILDSIGSLFDGWFADGGQIGPGKFGIVGERGPEFVSGPATVTPMTGSTNVTYNINAVDAASFKAMIARDPSFIHAVAQQGAKTIPGRR